MCTGCVGAAATGASSRGRPDSREKMTALSDRFFRHACSPRCSLLATAGGARRSASTTSPRAPAAWRRGPTRRRSINMPTRAARARLRRLPRHPLPAREGALARREAAVRADVLPPGTRGPGAGADQRHRAVGRARRRLRPGAVRLRQEQVRPADAERPRLQRLSRPLRRSTSRATRTRSLVFQGASYFRALGKGQSYGLSARGLAVDTAGADGRGVPALRRVLDRAAARQRDLADDLRAARLARASPAPTASSLTPGRRDGDAGDGAALPARGDRQARHRAADQHVRLRREPAGPRRLPPRGARLRRPVDPARRRRVDLAPAGQPAPPARHLVRARPTRAASA